MSPPSHGINNRTPITDFIRPKILARSNTPIHPQNPNPTPPAASMAADPSEAAEVEKLYQYGERLGEAKDKAQVVGDFEGIIKAVKGQSTKAKQLAAQLIPRFMKFFPALGNGAMDSMFDLLEEEDLAVRVHAIRGLSLLCKDRSDYVSKIVDVLVQLLTCEENVERDAVHKALMSLLRQDVKAALTALFKQVENNDESIHEKVIWFLKDKVFPLKAELLKPQVDMERHATDLVKSLQDVTGAEFKLFIDFLKTFSIFGEKAPPEQVQELIQIIEGQADLNAQFNVSDVDHIDRLMACMQMALPFFTRGASSSKFLHYLNAQVIPAFEKIPEERKLDLLKSIAGSSPYAAAHDSRQLLPSIVQLLKKYMPGRKTDDANLDYVECLLFTFHHFAHKTPNSTNSLCGYKIVTGQPSDRLGEDFSENNKEFTERLSAIEEIVRSAMKKLAQGMAEHNKSLSKAKTDEEKAKIKAEQQKSTNSQRMCHNILAMAQPLHLKAPSFIGDKRITLSWEPAKSSASATAGGKRAAPAFNGSIANAPPFKRGRGDGGTPNLAVNRAGGGLIQGGGIRGRRRRGNRRG